MPSPEDNAATAEGNAPDAPKYVTAEEVAQMVTGAVHANLNKALPKALEGLKIGDLVQEAVKKAAPPPKPDDTKSTELKPDPRLAAIEEKYKALEAQYKQAEDARKAAEQRSRDESARSALRAALKDVRPEAADMAVKLLFDADKRVTFDEDGRPLFTVRRSPVPGMPEEDVPMPLADGVAHWLKSDDAKMFLPAPAAPQGPKGAAAPARFTQRGQDGMPRYDAPATTDEERARRVQEKEQALKAQLGIT